MVITKNTPCRDQRILCNSGRARWQPSSNFILHRNSYFEIGIECGQIDSSVGIRFMMADYCHGFCTNKVHQPLTRFRQALSDCYLTLWNV